MEDYRYLIVGGGMAAAAAARGIRTVDPDGTIGVLAAEPDPPYDRPPLTKGLWKDAEIGSIWRELPDGVDVRVGCAAVGLDLAHKTVSDERGRVHGWEKLLIATGGTPRRLGFGGDEVLYYRTLADYRRMRALTGLKRCFAVIGGGFIGSELAAALAMNEREPIIVLRGPGIGAHLFPRELVEFLNGYYRERGVVVETGVEVVGVGRDREHVTLRLRSQGGAVRELRVDGVVAGLGIAPNDDVASSAGLEVDDGVLVDEQLRTSHPDVFAAGDVARFTSPVLGRRLRVEHEDAANTMGELAGRNMAGASESFTALPFFYSDLFDLGYEAVGLVDARLETFADWKEPFREGVIYYLEGGRVRGVLLWNVWEQVDAARAVITEPGPFTPDTLKGRIG